MFSRLSSRGNSMSARRLSRFEELEPRRLFSTYTVVDLGTKFSPADINDNGEIAGTYGSANSVEPGYWSASTGAINLDPTGDGSGFAEAINNSGIVVGQALGADPDNEHAFHLNIRDHKTIKSSDFVLGDASSDPETAFHDVDNSFNGLSVGTDENFSDFGIYFNGKAFAVNPKDDTTTATGIADYSPQTGFAAMVGTIAGDSVEPVYINGGVVLDIRSRLNSSDDGDEEGSLKISPNGKYVVGDGEFFSDGLDQPFYYLPNSNKGGELASTGKGASASAVNNSGEVVGQMNGTFKAYADLSAGDGKLQLLDNLLPKSSAWNLVDAVGVNSSGEICGSGTLNGQEHGFLLIPGGSAQTSISGTVSGGKTGETIYLDKNNNSKLDSGEISTTITSSSGAYSFSNVPAGAYIIRQMLPSGYTQTSPASNGGIHLTVSSGGHYTNENFTDKSTSSKSASIAGLVFSDSDGNGKQNGSEGGLSNVELYLDANNDGKQDNGETITHTDSKGNYTFSSLGAGNYIVRAISPSKYKQTLPSSNLAQHVTLTSGQKKTGVLFGEKKIS